jgi:hypothetical protein
MLRRDISKKEFEDAKKEELRYLFYLSRNDAWVSMDDELVKFNLLDLIETVERPEGKRIFFDKKLHPFNQHDSDKCKHLFSKIVNHIAIFAVDSNGRTIEATGHPTLPPLKINVYVRDMYDLTIFRDPSDQNFQTIKHNISVHATLKNYDALFIERFNALNLDGKINAIEQYALDKKEAFNEAFKNAVWLAVASGDSKQLALLLDERKDFDIHELYKGKNVIQAMFSATREYQRPFLNEKSDYATTLDILLAKGFDFYIYTIPNDQRTTFDICCGYKEAESNKWFFQSKNQHHLMLISLIEKALDRTLYRTPEDEQEEIPRIWEPPF